MNATQFIAACEELISAGRVFDFDTLPRYDALTSAKKAEVGIGVPEDRRNSRAPQQESGFFHDSHDVARIAPFLADFAGERATSRRSYPGTPTPQGLPPSIGVEGGRFQNLLIGAIMADALIPVFSGAISDTTVQLCDARTLHEFMQVKRDFTTWIRARIRKFGFVENEDYLLTKSGEQLPSGTKYVHDYHLTLDMAKELSMVENNEQGRAARKYFIACERQAMAAVAAPLPTPYTVQPTDTLTEPQQIALRALLESNVKRLPHDKQAGAMVKGWSKLKAHFGVPYRRIPASEFTEAISIVARHVAEWELIESPAKRQPSDFAIPPGHMLVERRALAALWVDLGKLKRRIDAMAMPESDLSPSWWAQQSIGE